jgi:hypothetical protein
MISEMRPESALASRPAQTQDRQPGWAAVWPPVSDFTVPIPPCGPYPHAAAIRRGPAKLSPRTGTVAGPGADAPGSRKETQTAGKEGRESMTAAGVRPAVCSRPFHSGALANKRTVAEPGGSWWICRGHTSAPAGGSGPPPVSSVNWPSLSSDCHRPTVNLRPSPRTLPRRLTGLVGVPAGRCHVRTRAWTARRLHADALRRERVAVDALDLDA